jgi:glycosyltransferase involved in cell wall biosynthesis
MAATSSPTPVVLFVVSEDWYFVSHRLPQARAVRDLGCRVIVAARLRDHAEVIRAEGVEPVDLPMVRGSMNPLRELRSVVALWRLIRRYRPAVMHCVALKPILHGGLAALAVPRVRVINAFTGMGGILGHGVERRLLHRVLAGLILMLSRANRAHAIVQNADDQAFLVARGIAPAHRVMLIPGSGVDVTAFAPAPEPEGPVTVLMVARLLREKGVGELVEAARLLRERGVHVRTRIAGERDPENPKSVSREEIAEWQSRGDVEFLGRRADVAQLWREAHVAVLPSYYGEGVPKSLLEAAAAGRPIVTTSMPGCRDLVPQQRTGLLVPPRDPAALADALARLAAHGAAREEKGRAARSMACERFAEAQIAAATEALYREILGGTAGLVAKRESRAPSS